MKSPKNWLILVLVLATAAAGVLAWQQHLALLKAQASGLSDAERADWQKRLWDAEKRIAALTAALQTKSAVAQTADDSADPAADEPGTDRRGRRFGFGGRGGIFDMLSKNPEFAKLRAEQEMAGLDSRYAGLFKQLNLSPADLQQFKNLLVQKQNAMSDVLTAARDQGLTGPDSRAAVRQLMQQSQEQIDASIQQTLGPDKYAQFQAYEQTTPERNTVGQLAQALSYSGSPLQDYQSQQLVQIMANNTPNNSNASNPTNFRSYGTARITDQDISQAQAVLTPDQVTALQQLQQQQASQQKMRQMIRQAVQQSRAAQTAAPASGR